MNKNALIIGGNGYLGRHLYPKLLEENYNVIITGINNPDINVFSKNPQLTFYQFDYTKPDTFKTLTTKKYELVIIMASLITGIGKSNLSNIDIEVNSIGLLRFLSYLQGNKLSENFIYVSSMTVYSEKNNSPVKEDGILQPINSYGLSKLLAENIFSFFCKSGNLKGIIIRPPGLYGGDRRNGFIYNAIKTLDSDKEFHINSSGLGYWEAINVNDLVSMIIKFLKVYKWEKNIEVFNFSYGVETDFYETAKFIAESLGKQNKLFIDETDKGYRKLFLSNEKLLKHISFNFNYKQSLANYINTIKE